MPGTLNDGKCSQNTTKDTVAGQCPCKQNVFGTKCDECEEAYFGLRLPPVGNCQGKVGEVMFCTSRHPHLSESSFFLNLLREIQEHTKLRFLPRKKCH